MNIVVHIIMILGERRSCDVAAPFLSMHAGGQDVVQQQAFVYLVHLLPNLIKVNICLTRQSNLLYRIGSDIFTEFIREHLTDLSKVVCELLLLVVITVVLVLHEVLLLLGRRVVIHVESRH